MAVAFSKQAGSEKSGARRTGNRNGSKRSVPKPPSPSESPPTVSPWYAPPNARYAVRPSTPWFTQNWKAIFSACSTAEAPSDANRTCGESTGTTSASASANSTTTRLPLPSSVEWATLPSWSTSASSSSGTRWPSVVTHSDEIASK
jgi:hypothetical protein